MTPFDQGGLRRLAALRGDLPDAPACECRHGVALAPCPARARFRVVLLCQVEDCDCAVRSHLACGRCKDDWVRQTAEEPRGPRLRIDAL